MVGLGSVAEQSKEGEMEGQTRKKPPPCETSPSSSLGRPWGAQSLQAGSWGCSWGCPAPRLLLPGTEQQPLPALLQIKMRSAGAHSRQEDPSLGQSHCFNTTAQGFCAEEEAVEEGTFRNCGMWGIHHFSGKQWNPVNGSRAGVGKQLYRKAT